MTSLCSHAYRQLSQAQPVSPHTPRKCCLKPTNDQHVLLIRRFSGSTFEDRAVEFSCLFYRCVQMHCRKHISPDIALQVIVEWVASCFSDAPIRSFESPVLSPRLLTSAAATSELLTSSSTQESFETFHSEESFISEVAGDAAAYFMDGWGPDPEDLRL
jgi:hypothetical protein